MKKNLLRTTLVAVASALLLAGCATNGGSDGARNLSDPRPGNGAWWSNHLAGYFYVFKRDLTSFYRTVDRHVFDYDWDDPNLD